MQGLTSIRGFDLLDGQEPLARVDVLHAVASTVGEHIALYGYEFGLRYGCTAIARAVHLEPGQLQGESVD